MLVANERMDVGNGVVGPFSQVSTKAWALCVCGFLIFSFISGKVFSCGGIFLFLLAHMTHTI